MDCSCQDSLTDNNINKKDKLDKALLSCKSFRITSIKCKLHSLIYLQGHDFVLFNYMFQLFRPLFLTACTSSLAVRSTVPATSGRPTRASSPSRPTDFCPPTTRLRPRAFGFTPVRSSNFTLTYDRCRNT